MYDEYGNQIKTGDEDFLNEATYTGAIYDDKSELYYMNARYYSASTGQFTTRDTYLGNISNPATHNLYTYTGNNPINFIDPTGHAWYHWALAAVAVVIVAAVVVITCGGALPALAAIAAVASGTAAATTASTVAAGVFIASSTALGFMAIDAAVNSNSIKEFMDQGDWGTVISTVAGGVLSGTSAWLGSRGSAATSSSIKGNTSAVSNEATQWLNKGESNYSVYHGIQEGEAVYTGITKQTLAQRLYQHNYNGKAFEDLKGIFSGIGRNQARAIEQYFITNGPANAQNIINSISPSSKYDNEALTWAENFMK